MQSIPIEDRLTLAELGRKIGRTYRTIHEMVTVGRMSVSKSRVYLYAIRAEGGYKTSMKEYERFIERLNT